MAAGKASKRHASPAFMPFSAMARLKDRKTVVRKEWRRRGARVMFGITLANVAHWAHPD
jgi:hypothetical protein